MKDALLIIDVQNDYFPNGRYELYHANETLEVIKKLIIRFRQDQRPIIYIQHMATSSASFLVENTDGAKIHNEIQPQTEDKIIEKHSPNSFHETELQAYLQERGIKALYVCGMMSHMCVDTTVRAAKDLGYHVTVFEDACTTRSLNWKEEQIPASTVHKAFMASLNGAFANVVSFSMWESVE